MMRNVLRKNKPLEERKALASNKLEAEVALPVVVTESWRV